MTCMMKSPDMLPGAGHYFRDFDLPTGIAFSCAVFM